MLPWRILPLIVQDARRHRLLCFNALCVRCGHWPAWRPVRKHARHRQPHNPRSSGASERSRAGIEGRARRKYIIYQQYTELVNLSPLPRSVGATHCTPTLLSSEPVLVRPRFCSDEEVAAERQAQQLCEGACDQFGLVVASFTQTQRVQRYGYHDIGGDCFRAPSDQFR